MAQYQIQPIYEDSNLLDEIISGRDWLLKNCKERLPEVDCDTILGTKVVPIYRKTGLPWYVYAGIGFLLGKLL